jgi:hypothetical protein
MSKEIEDAAPEVPTVDMTQLQERLRLTPNERLQIAVDSANNLRAFQPL